MKLPNWFKIGYWFLLVAAIFYFFIYPGYDKIRSGEISYLFIFLIWLSLVLLPLFNEFNFFGIKLKNQISELESELRDLKVKISSKNLQEMNINFSPTPPNDEVLQKSEKEIKQLLEQALDNFGKVEASDEELSPPLEVNFLFKLRYNLEKEIRRIYENNFNSEKVLPLMKLISELNKGGIISMELFQTIRNVYSISSPAVHGYLEDISEKQYNYAKEVGPDLVSVLRELN